MDSTAGRYDDATGGILNRITLMEKGLKIWQAIIATIVLLISIGTVIVNLSNSVETQKLRIEFLESGQRDMNLQYKEINSKLTDILVKLENKENKK